MEEFIQVKYKAIKPPVVGFYHNILSIYQDFEHIPRTNQIIPIIPISIHIISQKVFASPQKRFILNL